MADATQVVPVEPPNFPYRQFEQGMLQAAAGKNEEAIAQFSAAIKDNPGYQAAYAQRGLARYFQGEYDQALADCTEALRLAPKSPSVLATRARVYLAQRKYGQAVADAAEAIRLDAACQNDGIRLRSSDGGCRENPCWQ